MKNPQADSQEEDWIDKTATKSKQNAQDSATSNFELTQKEETKKKKPVYGVDFDPDNIQLMDQEDSDDEIF